MCSTGETTPEGDALRIEQIVSGGDGMARRADGCVVFVPRTVVGDLVDVEYTEVHRQWRRARLIRVVEPGPHRRDAPCPHYARCGGCQLQHVDYEAQLTAKTGIVLDCLQRLGGLTTSHIEIERSPHEFGYRNRISLVVRQSGARIAVGYHALSMPDEVVDVTSCPLAEEPINAVWASLHDTVGAAFSVGDKPADVRLTLRASAVGRVGLAVERAAGRGEINVALDLLQSIPGLDSVWVLDSQGRIVQTMGLERLTEQWDAFEIPLSGTAFLQVNREAAAVLDRYVVEQCSGVTGGRVVDAYCGFGLRALALSRIGLDVTGIDVDRQSVRVASRLAGRTGLKATFVSGTVEGALDRQLPADIVILNPPRRGVGARVTDTLARRPPARMVYVSCDPATLARDIKALGKRFELSACRAFDLFPQTAHVETVATLTRR